MRHITRTLRVLILITGPVVFTIIETAPRIAFQ